MRRILSAILSLALILVICIPAMAADTGQFSDIKDHWALPYIEQVVGAELMNGVSVNAFSPDAGMTRGMFVTVLGRFAGINPDAWKMNYDGVLFSDVSDKAYYASYINWAARVGISRGIGQAKFDPDSLITREQMLTMLKRFADLTGMSFHEFSVLGTEENEKTPFSDADEIAGWAKDAVAELRDCGIIQGIANEDGTFRFAPKSKATRAQAAAIFCRMKLTIAPKPGWVENYVTLVNLDSRAATLTTGETRLLKAQPFPNEATNKNICWVSSNPSVVSVNMFSDSECAITGVGVGSCTIYAFSSNGCKAACDVVCEKPRVSTAAPEVVEEPVEFVPQDLSLAYQSESRAQKMERIFGGYVSDPRTVYSCNEEAKPYMVTITVPVWDIGDSGEKYTRYFNLEVHRNIAATVDQIFREIYACPARYPIHSLGGYRYESMSEHNCGLAIDISPNENYYCSPSGAALVGSFFSPETNEYSIPVGGEIDQIFAKYGFTRGIYWRSGYKDYMHYSFFGT